MPIPSRDAQLPPPAVVREGAEARGHREKTRLGRRGSPLYSTSAPPAIPGQTAVGAVAASPLAPPREPPRRACEHTKTERRARDTREKTSARPPLATVRCSKAPNAAKEWQTLAHPFRAPQCSCTRAPTAACSSVPALSTSQQLAFSRPSISCLLLPLVRASILEHSGNAPARRASFPLPANPAIARHSLRRSLRSQKHTQARSRVSQPGGGQPLEPK